MQLHSFVVLFFVIQEETFAFTQMMQANAAGPKQRNLVLKRAGPLNAYRQGMLQLHILDAHQLASVD